MELHVWTIELKSLFSFHCSLRSLHYCDFVWILSFLKNEKFVVPIPTIFKNVVSKPIPSYTRNRSLPPPMRHGTTFNLYTHYSHHVKKNIIWAKTWNVSIDDMFHCHLAMYLLLAACVNSKQINVIGRMLIRARSFNPSKDTFALLIEPWMEGEFSNWTE